LSALSPIWKTRIEPLSNRQVWVFPSVLTVFLVAVEQYDFLTFHLLSELFAIVISFIMFTLAWTTYDFSKNFFLIFIACGYFWIGALDLTHTMVYKGMNLFVEDDGNLSTQFWVSTRYFEALLLVSAPFFAQREIGKYPLIFGFGCVAVTLFALVLSGNFPTSYIDGVGLTPFKVYSEYAIIAILALSLITLYRYGRYISTHNKSLIALSIVLTMSGELAFTFYVGVYERANFAGHIFKIFSYWMIFQAIVATNLRKPYFDLKASHDRIVATQSELTKLSKAVEQSSATVIITDTSGNIEYVNLKFVETAGYTAEEVIGRNPRFLKSGHTSSEEYTQLWETVTAGHEWQGEFHNKKKNGELYWEAASISPVKNEDGTITNFLAIKEDITKRKAYENALRSAKEDAEYANYTKTQFLANMSHELRTPLNGIIGFSEMMTQEILGPLPATYSDYAADIHLSGQHLLALITDILDTSKLEVGEIDLKETKNNLSILAATVVHLLQQKAEDKSISVTIEIPDDLALLYADATRLKQILLNLLSNAIKFTPANGRVTVDAHLNSDGAMVLRVADTGRGISADDIPKVLEPFKQVESIMTRSHEGSGLGLPLSKRLVELHGGSLEIESQLGSGTTVSVRFPPERTIATVSAQ